MNSDPSELEASLTGGTEYLTFFIAGEEYAVSLEFVREVIPYDTVTRVPGMPETVRGVTNLRGNVVPVIDLAIKFRLPQVPVTSRTCIVLVETTIEDNVALMGLMTERVGQVLALGPGELLDPPLFGTPIRPDCLLGMAQVGKKFALVIDILRLLSPNELLAHETSAALADEIGADPAAAANQDPKLSSAPHGANAKVAVKPFQVSRRAC